MALRINFLLYNRFEFSQQSIFLWDKTGPPLATPSASGSYGMLAEEMRLDFEIYKILHSFTILIFICWYQCNVIKC